MRAHWLPAASSTERPPARIGRRRKGFDEVVPVGQQHGDPVTLGEPQPRQRVGGSVSALVEFGEAEPQASGLVYERLRPGFNSARLLRCAPTFMTAFRVAGRAVAAVAATGMASADRAGRTGCSISIYVA